MVDRTQLHTQTMTAERFLLLPETNIPTELIDGVVVVSPSPDIRHQELSSNTNDLLKRIIPNGKVYYAPMDVHLDEENVVQPDLFWISKAGQCHPVDGKYFYGPPDLVIEILSPSTSNHDRDTKFSLYEKHGVEEYWIIDRQAEIVRVWSLIDAKFSERGRFGREGSFLSPILKRQVDVDEIFAD